LGKNGITELADYSTMSTQQLAMRGLIKGLVQGVFFRMETQQQALQRQLTGWVRNTSTGHVEVLICGDEANVGSMIEWLHQGPALAKVSAVELARINNPELEDFQIVS